MHKGDYKGPMTKADIKGHAKSGQKGSKKKAKKGSNPFLSAAKMAKKAPK